MRQENKLLLISLIFISCHKSNKITGTWKVKGWTGDSYSVFKLVPDSSKTLYDDFIYSILTGANSEFSFNNDNSFSAKSDSSKSFNGKFDNHSDSSITLTFKNRDLIFSFIKRDKDSMILYTSIYEQIRVKNLKLTLVKTTSNGL